MDDDVKKTKRGAQGDDLHGSLKVFALELLVEKEPTNIQAKMELGSEHARLGNIFFAARQYREILAINPHYRPAYESWLKTMNDSRNKNKDLLALTMQQMMVFVAALGETNGLQGLYDYTRKPTA